MRVCMQRSNIERSPAKPGLRLGSRRGVVGILAMIFLVMFASLATTMAIVTKGNMRAAVSHERVTRSLTAVDTGMQLAETRLLEAAQRLVVPDGRVTPALAGELWDGAWSSGDGVIVLPPAHGRVEPAGVQGIRAMLEAHHAADAEANTVVWGDDENVPAPIFTPAEAGERWAVGAPIGLQRSGEGLIVTAAQISYLPPVNGRVLVVVTGYNWDFTREQWVTRTAQQEFDLTKRIEHALLAPSRVMIGRNVQVTGPLGVRYDSAALDSVDGPPLTMKSDFEGLDPDLDAKLQRFFDEVLAHDVDGDNKLRIHHSQEGVGAAALVNWAASETDDPDAFDDATRDNAIGEFDIFIKHYDTNGDDRLTLGAPLSTGTDAELLSAEFTADPALALLIDGGVPDRNGNGDRNGAFVNGSWDLDTFPDNNGDGVVTLADVDQDDVTMGYRDGFLDYRDRYAKIHGQLEFRVPRAQWEDRDDGFGAPLGDFQRDIRGTIAASADENPVSFGAGDDEIPEITPESFSAATQTLIDIAESYEASQPAARSFAGQVADAMGAGWTPPTVIEGTPYGAPSPADYYERPVYTGITFRNVTIPMGTNALFVDCTFIGVTFVDTYPDNTHPSWPFYGTSLRNADGTLGDLYPRDGTSTIALDKSWADPSWENYDTLPDPLMVSVDLDGDGATPDQCVDTKRLSNNLRFHDCTFVGSIVTRRTTAFHTKRNKIVYTGATRFLEPDDPDFQLEMDVLLTDEQQEAVDRSSMMLPNYSVDIGTNNADPNQDVNLSGAIITGLLDVRGNATIEGVLLNDFAPVRGEAPMSLYGDPIGDPADFNITLGYFGPDEGDEEGFDYADLEDIDGDGQLDIGSDTARDPATGALIELDFAISNYGADPAAWPAEWFDGVADTDADFYDGDFATRAVPFNGFGRITINYDPTLVLPDGLATPLTVEPVRVTYIEGKLEIVQ